MNTTPTPPAIIPQPALAQVPVQALQAHFATELPWLTHRYGLVQTGQRQVEKRTERYPQLYQQDGSGKHQDIRPADDIAALCFFEINGQSEYQWDPGAENIAGSWLHPLAAVVWANLPRIDAGRAYDFTPQLAQDFVRALLSSGIAEQVSRLEMRQEEVFKRYSWDVKQHQLTMYPNGAFRVPFTARTPGPLGCEAPFSTSSKPQ